MIDRRRFLLALGPVALGGLTLASPGCGDSTPTGVATPTDSTSVEESPPELEGVRAKRKKAR